VRLAALQEDDRLGGVEALVIRLARGQCHVQNAHCIVLIQNRVDVGRYLYKVDVSHCFLFNQMVHRYAEHPTPPRIRQSAEGSTFVHDYDAITSELLR